MTPEKEHELMVAIESLAGSVEALHSNREESNLKDDLVLTGMRKDVDKLMRIVVDGNGSQPLERQVDRINTKLNWVLIPMAILFVITLSLLVARIVFHQPAVN